MKTAQVNEVEIFSCDAKEYYAVDGFLPSDKWTFERSYSYVPGAIPPWTQFVSTLTAQGRKIRFVYAD